MPAKIRSGLPLLQGNDVSVIQWFEMGTEESKDETPKGLQVCETLLEAKAHSGILTAVL